MLRFASSPWEGVLRALSEEGRGRGRGRGRGGAPSCLHYATDSSPGANSPSDWVPSSGPTSSSLPCTGPLLAHLSCSPPFPLLLPRLHSFFPSVCPFGRDPAGWMMAISKAQPLKHSEFHFTSASSSVFGACRVLGAVRKEKEDWA